MSDESDDGTLEKNVERLLQTAAPPPRMAPAARARGLERLLAAQAERPRAKPPADPKDAAGQGLGAPPAPVSFFTRRRAGLAASALALAAAFSLWATRPAVVVVPTKTYENAGPRPKEFTLRDGSRATLDAGAVLVERASRTLELVTGQAVFDVSRQTVPFTVETKRGRADATGTRFWMQAGPESARVAVAKGKVEIVGTRGDRRILRAGEEGALRGELEPTSGLASRVSHYFEFARAEGVEPPGASRRAGTLTARNPRWGGEQPIELRAFEVDVHVEDGFARTTIDQTYFNPVAQQLEGTYALTMPRGAALSRLGMYVDGELMEGAIVERSRGRDVYEGIVHERRDPALLEWMSDSTFRMRVFPLLARAEKRIFLSYTQPLEHLVGSERLVVPIPTVDQRARKARFTVRVTDAGGASISSPSHDVSVREDGRDKVVSFEASDYALGKDLVLTLGGAPTGGARTFEDGADRYVLVRSTPELRSFAEPMAREAPRRVVILFDTSASRSEEDLAAQARFVDGLVDAIDDTDEISVITVGHDAEVMPGGPRAAAKLDRHAVGAFLQSHGEGVGDTRLDRGLAAASRELAGAAGEPWVVYVGDGITVGRDGGQARAEGLARELGGARFVGVGIGDSVDRGLLDALADASDGLAISVGETDDPKARAFDLVSATYAPCLSRLEVEVLDAAKEPIPDALGTLASRRVCEGERLEVVARAPSGGAAPTWARVRGFVGGAPWEDTLAIDGGRTAAYLPRVFAERRIASLLADEPPGPGRAESPHAKEITALATRHFLVTPFTSLLVLENDAMYKQFGLKREKPRGWALYPAPLRFDAKVEPLSPRAFMPLGAWDPIERVPTQGLNARSDDFDLRSIDVLGSAGPFATLLRGGRPAVGVGGDFAGAGFGSGSGRLSGRHRHFDREDSRRLVTRTLGPRLFDGRTKAAFLENASFGGKAEKWGGVGGDWVDDALHAGTWLRGLSYSTDQGLDDLTEFVPTMFPLPVDAVSDLLDGRSPGVVEPLAKQLLEQAAKKAKGTWAGPRGELVSVDDRGEIIRERKLATDLRERAQLSDGKLTFDYAELGLRTRRSVGPAGAWWQLGELPWIAPRPEQLEGLVVTAPEPNTVRISLPVASAGAERATPVVELAFDAERRVVRLTVESGTGREEVRLSYEDGTVRVQRLGEPAVVFTPSARALTGPSGEQLIDVELPLSQARRWEDQLAAKTGDVVFARRQLLATYAALHDSRLGAELELLARSVIPSRGDLALASRALVWRSGLEARLAVLPEADPMRSYLAAAASGDKRGAGFAKVGDAAKDTLAGTLARYRGLLWEIEQPGKPKALLEKVRALHDEHPEARFFRYAAVRRAADRMRGSDDDLALALWDTLADDPLLGRVADREAAQLLLRKGKAAAGAERAVRSFEGALESGAAVELDWQLRSVVIAGRGQAGFDLLVAKWRRRVLDRGNARQALGLLRTALRGDAPALHADVGAIARRFDGAPGTNDQVRLAAVGLLLRANLRAEAKQVFAPLLGVRAPSPGAVELAVLFAEGDGDLGRAAALLDGLLRATANEPLDLEIVRSWYAKLFDLHARRAELGGAGAASVRDALAVAARWRREDPGNGSIDELCAAALFRLGRRELGLRYAYSIAERRPAEGDAWGKVGELLLREGDLVAAEDAYRQAADVEPTNPRWSVDRARVLLLRDEGGDRARAMRLLEAVSKGSWQARYANSAVDARSLLASAP